MSTLKEISPNGVGGYPLLPLLGKHCSDLRSTHFCCPSIHHALFSCPNWRIPSPMHVALAFRAVVSPAFRGRYQRNTSSFPTMSWWGSNSWWSLGGRRLGEHQGTHLRAGIQGTSYPSSTFSCLGPLFRNIGCGGTSLYWWFWSTCLYCCV